MTGWRDKNEWLGFFKAFRRLTPDCFRLRLTPDL
jgi:hypothetical protein